MRKISNIKCKKCGKLIRRGHTYCGSCGKLYNEKQTAPDWKGAVIEILRVIRFLILMLSGIGGFLIASYAVNMYRDGFGLAGSLIFAAVNLSIAAISIITIKLNKKILLNIMAAVAVIYFFCFFSLASIIGVAIAEGDSMWSNMPCKYTKKAEAISPDKKHFAVLSEAVFNVKFTPDTDNKLYLVLTLDKSQKEFDESKIFDHDFQFIYNCGWVKNPEKPGVGIFWTDNSTLNLYCNNCHKNSINVNDKANRPEKIKINYIYSNTIFK